MRSSRGFAIFACALIIGGASFRATTARSEDESLQTYLGKMSGAKVTPEDLVAAVKRMLREEVELRRQLNARVVPVGTIEAFGGPVESIPSSGWLPCDGKLYSKQDPKYKQLAMVLGNAWGGDATAFRVPDLRGHFLRGVTRDLPLTYQPRIADDVLRRFAAYNGGNTGNAVGSYQDHQFQGHGHLADSTIDPPKHSHKVRVPGGGGGSGKPGSDQGLLPVQSDLTELTVTTTIGLSGGSETRPMNANVNWMIKFVSE